MAIPSLLEMCKQCHCRRPWALFEGFHCVYMSTAKVSYSILLCQVMSVHTVSLDVTTQKGRCLLSSYDRAILLCVSPPPACLPSAHINCTFNMSFNVSGWHTVGVTVSHKEPGCHTVSHCLARFPKWRCGRTQRKNPMFLGYCRPKQIPEVVVGEPD